MLYVLLAVTILYTAHVFYVTYRGEESEFTKIVLLSFVLFNLFVTPVIGIGVALWLLISPLLQ